MIFEFSGNSALVDVDISDVVAEISGSAADEWVWAGILCDVVDE
jgi:hypothetical protein